MPLVGAVAAPHSHLQLFTRPAENEKYKADVQKGRNAMLALREVVERANPDTILVIHDDHFVNFDFRCYPPFAMFVGKEAKGSGVTDPDTIEKITGVTKVESLCAAANIFVGQSESPLVIRPSTICASPKPTCSGMTLFTTIELLPIGSAATTSLSTIPSGPASLRRMTVR